MIIHSITFVLNFNAEHAEKTHIFVQNLSVVSTTSACLPPLFVLVLVQDEGDTTREI